MQPAHLTLRLSDHPNEGAGVDSFLAEVWQKRPLLIRKGFADWRNPLDPDELAGLACEAEVESRLVLHPQPEQWLLENGPFASTRFATLDGAAWTLLVQAVDHHVPEVAALIEAFRFLPRWRIDDVMVSYASDGGGVGPHFDQYDVFLVQGLGRRRWRIGPRCDDNTPLRAHDGLRLLTSFETVEEWVLEPGDILYVPPGFAHDGVAVGDDCMTYSVGFRAPSRGDLVSGFADAVLDQMREDDRYTDGALDPGANPGEIAPAAVSRLHAMVTQAMADEDTFARWFGASITAPRDERIDWSPEDTVTAVQVQDRAAAQPCAIERNPACRFAFIRHAHGVVTLFVDGTSFTCRGALAGCAEQLCGNATWRPDRGDLAAPGTAELIADLINRGCLAFADAD